MLKAVPLIALALSPTAFLAGQEEALLASSDQSLLLNLKPSLGLARDDSVRVARVVPDPLMQGHDARIVQYYRGVKVLGGEGILHMSGPRQRALTDAFVRDLTLEPSPGVPEGEALAVALKDLGDTGAYRLPPTSELLVARLAEGDALVYRVHVELENGAPETRHFDWLVDAQTGKILKKWSSLRTGKASKGEGLSQYNGTVVLDTTYQEKKKRYEMRDWTRGHTGNLTVNLNHRSEDSGGTPYTRSSDTWGDGRNYSGGGTATPNGETAAVDAAFGLQKTWDYYAKVHNRKGIDNKGTAVTMRVHYATDYDNAYWSNSCFCVTLGDGQILKSLEALDVIGHELSHGVCETTAALEYFGESGGLNEANSDINGCMVEFYARGGSGGQIGEWGGNWTIGEDLGSPAHPGPLRWMYKPSLDGSSPDAWTEELQGLDVHNSSGPMNRCFYFLAQGASPSRSSDFWSCFLPMGMPGLGNDRAARIWYRAMTHYLTSMSTYKDARQAAIHAAKDLYGPRGPEEQAVWNAFHGINVGLAWK